MQCEATSACGRSTEKLTGMQLQRRLIEEMLHCQQKCGEQVCDIPCKG